jgi:hypothetical protein
MFASHLPQNVNLIGPLTVAWACLVPMLLAAVFTLRSTTLLSPSIWCLIAWCPVLQVILTGSAGQEYAVYAAAVFLIAPTLALLGAKRPQNGAWQFIVGTLVLVLLLPVMQGWVFGDTAPHVHSLFRWVVVVHIVMGAANYLPTRYALSALLFAAAQFFMAAPFLPFHDPQAYNRVTPSIFCAVVALGWGWYAARRNTKQPPGVDRLWRDFRDAYGLVWGLRIAERLNASAQKHGWPVEFTWGGMLLRKGTTELDPVTQHRVERELRSHLRRFVSHDWIAARMPETRDVGTAP